MKKFKANVLEITVRANYSRIANKCIAQDWNRKVNITVSERSVPSPKRDGWKEAEPGDFDIKKGFSKYSEVWYKTATLYGAHKVWVKR